MDKMECKQCKLRIPYNSRSKVFIGYCRHCAAGIELPEGLNQC